MTDALAPLVAALRTSASQAAARTVADADATATALLADAHAEADTVLARARDLGRIDGTAAAARARADRLRAARATRLRAQDAAYRELGDQVAAAVATWCARPESRALLLRRIHDALGEDAVVADAPGGGLIATCAGRRLDLDVATLAARAVAALGADVTRLWTP